MNCNTTHYRANSSSVPGDPTLADEPALRARLIYDPGLGFAKTASQSLRLLGEVGRLKRALGGPLLIGASRKSMFAGLQPAGLPVADRLLPSVVAAALAVYQGADIVRVHDVPATHTALRLCAEIAQPGGEA